MATVLVVDDEADILELIKVNLELDGHRVLTALGGGEASKVKANFIALPTAQRAQLLKFLSNI